MEKHIINKEGAYIVQVLNDGAAWKLPVGAKEVSPRPGHWCDWTGKTWAENSARKYAAFSETVRGERDFKLLRDVDTIATNALRWASLTEAQRQAWADYRQALLDVPQQEGFPYNVVWPVKPK
jgi:hypothetical protein